MPRTGLNTLQTGLNTPKCINTPRMLLNTSNCWRGVETHFGGVETPIKLLNPPSGSQHVLRLQLRAPNIPFFHWENSEKRDSQFCVLQWFTQPRLVSCVTCCGGQHENTMTMLTLHTTTRLQVEALILSSNCCVASNMGE